ncbi:GntR family transcriptional regulator [Brevibacillus sp. H7]|jgi:DNA-binding GntR family transcriptional regulator|uniref:GntR family transcriptional regulator n=1 Tax=Brevibacillus sp. H7 TaxID=3349138 RepID=UPI0037F8AF61
MIEKSSPEPLYIQVQNWIKEKIASGEWKAKEKLPSESDLAAALDISRGTIKQAIKQLITEGILVQIHGKGTFVIGEQLEYPLAERLVSVAETMIENQKNFTTNLVSLELIPAGKMLAENLHVQADDKVWYMQRLRHFEGTPVVFLENYLPANLFPDLDQIDFTEDALFAIIENRYKTIIEWGKRSFLAKGADERISRILQIDKGTPVTFLEQTTYTSNDMPIEYSKVWLRSDQIKLTSILKRHQRN